MIDDSEYDYFLPEGHVVARRYELEGPIGSGGMGSVYAARDLVLQGETVAIKILHGEFSHDRRHTERFLREVQLMRRVNHPNVVRTYDVGADENLVYFTMEFVSGHPLDAIIESRAFPASQLPNVICEICNGLEAIHDAEIIHRDLKPGNILVLENCSIKIADFGVARPQSSELTAHNEIIGSSSYMAPEIWLGDELTSSVDLYSLGIILYELNTGSVPFTEENPAALMRAHLDRAPVPPQELNPQIAPWLNRLILRLLAKSPLERPRSAKEVFEYVQLHTSESSISDASEIADQASAESNLFLEKLEEISTQTLERQQRGTGAGSASMLRKGKLSWWFSRALRGLMIERIRAWTDRRPFVKRLLNSANVFCRGLLGIVFLVLLMKLGANVLAQDSTLSLEERFGARISNFLATSDTFYFYGSLTSTVFSHLAVFCALFLVLGMCSGKMRNLFLFTSCGLVFALGVTSIHFVLNIVPLFSYGSPTTVSLWSSFHLALYQLLETVSFSPQFTSFERTVLSEGVIFHSPSLVSVASEPYRILIICAFAFLMLFVCSYFVFSDRIKRKKLLVLVSSVLLLAVLAEAQFLLPALKLDGDLSDSFSISGLVLARHVIWPAAVNWGLLGLVLLFASVFRSEMLYR